MIYQLCIPTEKINNDFFFFANQTCIMVTWWGQAHDPQFLLPALGEYEHVRALAEKRTLKIGLMLINELI